MATVAVTAFVKCKYRVRNYRKRKGSVDSLALLSIWEEFFSSNLVSEVGYSEFGFRSCSSSL